MGGMRNMEEITFKSKEEVFWEDIKKQAQEELDKMEETYFKVMTFQKAVILLAEKELDDIRKSAERKEE